MPRGHGDAAQRASCARKRMSYDVRRCRGTNAAHRAAARTSVSAIGWARRFEGVRVTIRFASTGSMEDNDVAVEPERDEVLKAAPVMYLASRASRSNASATALATAAACGWLTSADVTIGSESPASICRGTRRSCGTHRTAL